ncbi:MAG: polyprenyl synthetase family protein [Holosporales bacterium]|jgi:heptaprenyl diphosphate synthase|nr:polyprenyl synthetase family protein [Holosporales bacterium]
MFSDIIREVISQKDSISLELKLVDELLSDALGCGYLESEQLSALVKKGKKLRATLFFQFFNKFSGKQQEAVIGKNIWTAALIEAIHFASIVHDDIIDDSPLRRGNLPFHKSFGHKFGILFGDYIFANASKRFLNLYRDNRLVQNLFLRECSSTILGAIREQELTISSDIAECLRVASLKTSPFFKLSCFLGTYLSSLDFEKAITYATFGTCFGVLYQLQNDLDCYKFENYFESEDYMQNNTTLPIMILYQYLNFNAFAEASGHQENYNRTKELMFSKQFTKILQNITKKYQGIVASNLS